MTRNATADKQESKTEIIKTDKIQDVLFPVYSKTTEEITGFPANSEYSKLVFATTPDGDRIVNACSDDRYEVVPCTDFAPAIRQIILDTDLEFQEKYKIINYAVMYGEIIIKDDRYYIGERKENDTLDMRIKWFHSYNGQEQYALEMGTFYRYKCTNGLWMTGYDTKEHGLSISGKHTKKIRTSLQLLQERLHFVLNNDVMQKMIEMTYQPLYDNWVKDWEDRVLEVMKVASVGTTKSNVEHVQNQITSEAKDLYGDANRVNDWLIYNGVNNLLFSDKFNALEGIKKAKDQKMLEALLQG